MTLPFVNDELTQYDNLPAIPPTQPLGDILEQLYALATGAQPFIYWQPGGGVSTAPIADTWADIEAILAAQSPRVPTTVYLADNAYATIPATANTNLHSQVTFSIVESSASRPQIEILDGGRIRNPAGFIGIEVLATPTVRTPIYVTTAKALLFFRQGASVNQQVGSTLPVIQMETTDGTVELSGGSYLSSPGGVGVIEAPAANDMTIVAFDNTGDPAIVSPVPDNSVQGGVGNSLFLRFDSTSVIVAQSLSTATQFSQRMDLAAWAAPSYGITADRPAAPTTLAPVTGQMYFDTTLGQPVWWDGAQWVDATGTPA